MTVRTRRRTAPRCSSPIVRRLFEVIDAERLHYDDVATRAGVHPLSLHAWKSGRRSPGIVETAAVAQAIGLRLTLEART